MIVNVYRWQRNFDENHDKYEDTWELFSEHAELIMPEVSYNADSRYATLDGVSINRIFNFAIHEDNSIELHGFLDTGLAFPAGSEYFRIKCKPCYGTN